MIEAGRLNMDISLAKKYTSCLRSWSYMYLLTGDLWIVSSKAIRNELITF